jgi:hypothetical protein
MHHKSTKRRIRARLTFVYTLMALAVIAGVAILVLVIQGYRYNRYDGKIEQGGLVQFDSRPSGATVTLDGTQLSAKTASKLTVSAGSHEVTMSRSGYLSWSKTVTVKAGSVLWLNYARLYPEKPVISTTTTYDAFTGALTSPNRKQLVVVASPAQAVLSLVSLNDETPSPRKVIITSSAVTAASDETTSVFRLVAWDSDSQFVLVQHAYDGKQEYLSVDTSGGTATNITRSLGVTISRIEYAIGDRSTVYILTDTHEVRRGDLSASTISGPLLSNIADFAQADRSTLTYETRRDDAGVRSVGYLTNGAARPRTVHTVTDDGTTSMKFRMGAYYGDDYLVLAYGDTTTIYTADVPSSDSSSTLSWKRVGWLSTAGGVSYLGFSPDSERFVYAQMASSALTYDLETDVIAKTTFESTMARPADWIDSFHVGATTGGSALFYDFDGTNSRKVATGVVDAPIAISENDNYLYYFATDGAATVLKRVKLVN